MLVLSRQAPSVRTDGAVQQEEVGTSYVHTGLRVRPSSQETVCVQGTIILSNTYALSLFNPIYQVNVNGNDYMPTVAVDNKKKAKANAAMACLQQMGLVPKDPDNPV